MDVNTDLKKYQWPIIIIGGVAVGLYLYWSNSSSTSSTSSSSGSSGSSNSATTAALQSAATSAAASASEYASKVNAQTTLAAYQDKTAATVAEANDAEQASIYASGATAAAKMAKYSANTTRDDDWDKMTQTTDLAWDAYHSYDSVQKAALTAGVQNNQTAAQLASNLYANSAQEKVDETGLNDDLAAYAIQQTATTDRTQDITQAYTQMVNAQSLAQQNVAGNNALASANEAGSSASATSGIGGVMKTLKFSGFGVSANG